MTAARQRENPVWVLLLSAFLMLSSFVGRALATSPIVNPDTGLAISGFDPVAYFTDAKPELGRPDLELTADGAVWRFRNEGNRAAFRAHPEVYRPAFGGYDPIALARNRTVPGHPLIWTIEDGRLYLFYSEQNREAFLADPGRILTAAERKWPVIARDLGTYTDPTFDGSPQAMNPGTRKLVSDRP